MTTVRQLYEFVMLRQRLCDNTDFTVGNIVESAYPIQYVQVSGEIPVSDSCFCGVDVLTGQFRNDFVRSAFFNSSIEPVIDGVFSTMRSEAGEENFDKPNHHGSN